MSQTNIYFIFLVNFLIFIEMISIYLLIKNKNTHSGYYATVLQSLLFTIKTSKVG